MSLLLLFSGGGSSSPPPVPFPLIAPALTEDDFLGALQAYLPPGRAWSRDDDAQLTQLLRGFAKATAEAHARQINLLPDAFPASTEELLPEWEATLGLPDPCAGQLPLISERVAQVVARIKARGGQSVPYFIQFALDLGYTITIKEFSPRRFGRAKFGDPYGGMPWAHHWEVDAPAFTLIHRLFGDAFGEPYADWASNVLQCELERLMPGHTTLSFAAA